MAWSAVTRCLVVLAAARSADQATPPLPDDAAAVVVDSERGDDTHPGTTGRPLRTLGEARDRLRASPSLHTILLRGGAHHTAVDFAFTAADAGTATQPVHIAAYPGDPSPARISAGIDIPLAAFQRVATDDPLYHRLPNPAAVLQVNLSSHGVRDLGQTVCTPTLNLCQSGMFALNRLEAFMGATPLHLARWPNLHGVETTGPGGDVRSWSRTTSNSSGKKIGLVSEAPVKQRCFLDLLCFSAR